MSIDETPGSRVLLLAPTRRDGEVTLKLLAQVGITCDLFSDPRVLASAIDDTAGALVLTESVVAHAGIKELINALDAQPAWSDIPCIVLAHNRDHAPTALQALRSLRNVVLLDRPVSTRSMLSAVTSALRARHRQYQIRDQLVAQQAAEQALRVADRRKDEFLATLAHELRNPLAPIRTGLQILDRAAARPDQVRQLREMMERQVSLLVKLIDELLNISRISTGKMVLQREIADMRSIVETALESTRPFVDAASHHLQVSLPEAPVWVDGDRLRLVQALGNLINNAAKYTPAGGRVAVVLRTDGSDVVVDVIDNGVGIPAAMLDEVFQLFTQVNQSLDRAQGGLGIGLALVRRMMILHGGSVYGHSDGLGEGSTFTMRLPAAEAPSVPLDDAIADEKRPAGAALRALVVDDNVDAAATLAWLLDSNGHTTRVEHTGEAALAALVDFCPDVVFCDLGLPGIDGNEVARRIRAGTAGASPTLVAVTGWGGEEDKKRTADAGFDFHLVKPVSARHIDDVLHRRAGRVAS